MSNQRNCRKIVVRMLIDMSTFTVAITQRSVTLFFKKKKILLIVNIVKMHLSATTTQLVLINIFSIAIIPKIVVENV